MPFFTKPKYFCQPTCLLYFTESNECLANCQLSEYKYTDGTKCVEYCSFPNQFATSDNRCVSICPENEKYNFNRKCTSKCPLSALYSTFNNDCVPDCPAVSLNFQPDTATCENRCKAPFQYRLNYICLDKCPSTAEFFSDTFGCLPKLSVTNEVM